MNLIEEYDSTWAEFEIGNAVLVLAASSDEADADNIGHGTFALAVDDVMAAADEREIVIVRRNMAERFGLVPEEILIIKTEKFDLNGQPQETSYSPDRATVT